MRRFTTRAVVLASLLVTMSTACNSEKRLEAVPVEGKVTFAGAPVTKGSITSRPKFGPIAYGGDPGRWHLQADD